MNFLKLLGLLLCVFCLGYGTAFLPVMQRVSPMAFHRWRPLETAIASPASLQIQGVGWVGTRTPYFDNTVAFFRDVLHLPLKMQSSQFAEFTLAGGERLGISSARSADSDFMKGPMMEFIVDDVDVARQQLEALGVQFIGDIHKDPSSGLTWTEFWGPDGHPYGLTSPTGSTTAA